MKAILRDFVWKSQNAISQPLVAIEVEEDFWIFVGGFWRLKQTVDPEIFNKLYGNYNYTLGVQCHEGPLSDDQKALLDFIFPYRWGQTSLDEKYYVES